MDRESERTRKLRLSRTAEHLAIRDKFVQPFDLKAGAFGFTKWEPHERDIWLREFAATSDELDEQIAQVLFDTQNWRGCRVGAWMVGYRDWGHFSPLLVERFRSKPTHAVSALAVGIAMLAVPSTAQDLCDFLDDGDPDSRGWLSAAASLKELDRVHGTNFSEPYVSADGVLERFRSEYRAKFHPDMIPPSLPPLAETVAILKDARERFSMT